MRNELTLQQGLDIQAEQLNRWKSILIPEVYNHLKEYCDYYNNKLTPENDGYAVCRGSALDNVIGNYRYNVGGQLCFYNPGYYLILVVYLYH